MKRALAGFGVAALTLTSPQAATVGPLSLSVDGRSSANVSLTSRQGLTVAVWSASLPGGETDIYAAASRDAGASFSTPVRVNSVAGDARVNGEQPPRATLAPRPGGPPRITVVWTSKNDQGGTLLSAQSDDGGRTFSKSVLVPGGAAAGNRGWENAGVDAQGRTQVVWLDHREMAVSTPMSGGASEGSHAGHDRSAPASGVSMAQKSKLYVATVGDASSAHSVTAGVCYCCKTAIVGGPDNTVYLAWRHVYPGNLRDIAFTFSQDGGRSFAAPIRVSEDHWQLDGCPDDGPAMTIDAAKRLHIVWPTLVSDTPDGRPSIGIFYARSRDGRSFGARERLVTEGLAHHPQIAINGDRLFAAWDELKDGRRRIVVAERSLRALSGFRRSVLAEAPGLLYPSLAPGGAGVLVAWTAAGARSTIQVARVE